MKHGLMMLLRVGGALVLLAVLLTMGGMFSSPDVGPGVNAAPAGLEAPAYTALVESRIEPVRHEAVGSVQSTQQVDISARVSGQILTVAHDVGERVLAGDLLITLDTDASSARLEQAQSALRAVQADATRAAAALARTKELERKGVATAEQLEDATAADDGARAGVDQARQRVVEVRVGLEHARITSPQGGVIAERYVDPGDMAWPGKPLLRLHDPDALRVEFALREGLAGVVSAGDTLTAQVGALEQSFEVRVLEILPTADPRTRTLRVRASLPTAAGISPGMFVRVELPVSERAALVVPARALRRVGQLQTLLVNVDGHWMRRYVTTGSAYGAAVEVLSGLSAGETVGWDD